MDTVDHVVVGGGVYGCGMACEFARRGREVVLLEAETAASGASGGLGQRGIRTNARDPRELPLMKRAHELWPTLANEIQAATGFERVGHLQLIEREEDVATARANGATRPGPGAPSHRPRPPRARAQGPPRSEPHDHRRPAGSTASRHRAGGGRRRPGRRQPCRRGRGVPVSPRGRVDRGSRHRAEATAHDLVPIIDAVPGIENALFATGWSGHGWGIAPAVIELLAQWVTTGRRPELLQPFGLRRFRA